MTRRNVGVLAGVVAVLLVLAGIILGARSCTGEETGADGSNSDLSGASSQEAGGDASGGANPAVTPTGPSMQELQIAWAGDFCRSRQVLKDAVGSLGSNLDWEFGTDASVLDQLDQQIRWQVLAIGSAANDLGMLLTEAPVDPAQANVWVMGITGPAQQAQASVDEVTGHLDDMLSADGFLEGVGAAGQVISSGAEAVAAGQELLTAVQETSDAAQAEFATAFAQAPSCQG